MLKEFKRYCRNFETHFGKEQRNDIKLAWENNIYFMI
jgi:hypothetical protein